MASSKGRVVEISGRNDQIITGQEIKELNLTDSDTLVISGNNNFNHSYSSGALLVFDSKFGVNVVNVKNFIFSDNQQKIEITEKSNTREGIFSLISLGKSSENNKANIISATDKISISNNILFYIKNNIFKIYDKSVLNILSEYSYLKAKNIEIKNNYLSGFNNIMNKVAYFNDINTSLDIRAYDELKISENIIDSKSEYARLIDCNSTINITADKIIINKNKVTPTFSFSYRPNDKYGVLIGNSGNMRFIFAENICKKNNPVFELTDNSLIDGSNGEGIIGILLSNDSKLDFINGDINYNKQQQIKLGHDIRSCSHSYTTITFNDNSNIELGTHIIEASNINIKAETNICVDIGKNGLVGNLRVQENVSKRNSVLYIRYTCSSLDCGLTFDPSFAEDFEDNGEEELTYKVISGFENIIGRERIKLKDEQKTLEWHGGIYSTRLVSTGNDFSIVLDRLVPPINDDMEDVILD